MQPVGSPERLTIDVTVARDYLDERREGHADAAAVFELARRGEVDIATAPQGYRLDATGELETQLRDLLTQEDVRDTIQLAYPSKVTYPGEGLIPGAYVKGFGEAWNRVTATWRPHEFKAPGPADRLHVETHVLTRRDVFLTADRGLLVMCRRLREEHQMPVEALTVQDYLRVRAMRR
jgi:hypothetical protein